MNDIKQKTDLITMGGIADCHGIESFLAKPRFDEQCSMLLMRAESNRQRHAVVYEVKMKPLDVKAIEEFIQGGDYVEALRMMKRKCVTFGFPTDKIDRYESSWSMIPNPKLDPWS